MKHYWLVLSAILIVSTMAMAQQAPSGVTNEQVKVTLKEEQKKENKKREKIEIAKQEQQDKVKTKPKYKKWIKQRKRKAKEGMPPAPIQKASAKE